MYAVDPLGFTGGREDYSESFANETGGQSFSNASNFDAAVGAIWREAGSYYLLGYPAPINDHRLHKIEVRVSRPGVRVRSRKGRG